jgi:hypothetical protein
MIMPERLGHILDVLRANRSAEICLGRGASADEIEEAFRPYTSRIPAELRVLYSQANGLRIGDLEVLPLESMLWPTLQCAQVHAWGNGDVDAACINPGAELCQVCFVGHDPPWEFVVAASLGEWLERVYAEWQLHGEVLDPWSCHVNRVARLYTPPPEVAQASEE